MVTTSVDEIGYPYAVEFEIYPDSIPNIDAILFKGPHSEFITNWQNTGKFAFRRDGYEFVFHAYRLPVTRVRDNILKSKEQKNIQPTKGGHKMVTCQNYVSLFYRQITSCPSDGGIS